MLRLSNHTGNTQTAVELHVHKYRSCKCGEANPSFVECPICYTLNMSQHPCRNCGGPGGVPKKCWEKCPSCGRQGKHGSRLATAWYANPFKQLKQAWKEKLEKMGVIKTEI